MSAEPWLSRWIDPRHLAPAALAAGRDTFRASRALVLRPFLREDVAAELSRFLLDRATYETGFGVFTRYGRVTRDEFEATPADRRFFRYGMITGVRAAGSREEATFRAARKAFSDPRMSAFFAAATGLDLGAAALSMRSMAAGDFMALHSDDINDRALSFFCYLTPGWSAELGGALMLADEAAGFVRIDALYNSVAMFDVRVKHYVAPFTDALGDHKRVTFGGWFLARAPRST